MDRTQKTIAGALVAALAIGGVAAAMWSVPAPVPRDPPNVLIVLWDTTRADRLTGYGYDKGTAPRLAKWAEGAVVFENAISPAMWTVPSHASLFTGKPPTTHGANADWRWLDSHNTTFGEHFRDNGYDTYAFTANPNASTRVNLLQGFDTVHQSWTGRFKGPVARIAQEKMLKQDRSTEISPAFDDKKIDNRSFHYNAGPITHKALGKWLDNRNSDKPFLAFLSYMESHKPRIPSLAARRRITDNKDDIRLQLYTDLSTNNQMAYGYGKVSYTDDELNAVSQVYDASLIDLDDTTADLLDDLEQRGLLDNTIVVFTSDHGELLGEHQLFGHRRSVYQSLVHVPLIVSWPAGLEGKRVTQTVSNLDIYNTIVELAGLPAPPDADTSRGNLIEGRPGRYSNFSESTAANPAGFERVQQLFPDVSTDPWNRTFRTLVDGDWKLITDSLGGVELYNLLKDHHEGHNLVDAEPSRTAEMQAKMKALTDGFSPYDASLREEGEGLIEDDAATKAQLEMLGYVDGDEDEDEDEVEGEDGG